MQLFYIQSRVLGFKYVENNIMYNMYFFKKEKSVKFGGGVIY